MDVAFEETYTKTTREQYIHERRKQKRTIKLNEIKTW